MQFQVSSESELTGKEIPELSRVEFLEKFLTNHFPLSDAEDNTFGLLNRGGIVDLPFDNTNSNSPKVLKAKYLGSDVLFCFISICNFGNFNPSATNTSLSKL